MFSDDFGFFPCISPFKGHLLSDTTSFWAYSLTSPVQIV
jgi:hypothetical protein